jgi:hypothetical protein
VFCRSPQSSFLSQCFAEQYGLSFRDWIDIAIAIFVRLHKKPRPIVRREQICIDAKRVTPVSVQRFLELASITPNQISDRYNTFHSADGVSWKLRCQYRPAVLEFPIILDDDDMIVPFPNLLWNLIEDKLFLLTKQIENTRRHLGDAFEHYVASILEEFPHPAKVEKVPVADRKRCDFSAKYTSGRVLVECKTISFLERKFLTHTAVANSGTISEIVDAIEQLVVTAEDLSDMSTHTDGIVVIWGEFMAANSDAVWETIYLPKLASKGIDNDRVRRSFRFRPQILTVEGLELLLMYCDIRSCEISQAIREKDGKPYSIVGEWPQYIMNSVGGLPCSKRSFWNALSDSAFLEALGFNEQDLQSYRSS